MESSVGARLTTVVARLSARPELSRVVAVLGRQLHRDVVLVVLPRRSLSGAMPIRSCPFLTEFQVAQLDDDGVVTSLEHHPEGDGTESPYRSAYFEWQRGLGRVRRHEYTWPPATTGNLQCRFLGSLGCADSCSAGRAEIRYTEFRAETQDRRHVKSCQTEPALVFEQRGCCR